MKETNIKDHTEQEQLPSVTHFTETRQVDFHTEKQSATITVPQ